MNLLMDKVVLVSGGTAGLGAGIARAAGHHGSKVVVTGRKTARGLELVAELETMGCETAFVKCDVGDVAQVRDAVTQTVQRFVRADCVVNSAGLTTRGDLTSTTQELFDQHIAVNLRGPFFMIQAAAEDMVKRGEGGTIVNILSIASHSGQPYLAPYVAAKAGLAGLTKNLAHAQRWHRIRINGLNIVWTQTDGEDEIQRRFHGAGDNWISEAAKALPMGKLGQVDEIAEVVVFLLSERSGVVTGSIIDWDQVVVGAHD